MKKAPKFNEYYSDYLDSKRAREFENDVKKM